ncbi:phenylalanine--tRNA ligase subunit beta [Beggiatoa leptomitoformis]|uniref:Phenylalanine--tRNA ligase beta subunit n=1 Tax=Beggiatoa leptomitoformis TaxID=288004 RepID=A0A2N9YF32_9GAMM|nr:phenylalanine--tRNA ligase subunit beta [Beggiatoa leptomitoformis]ALG68678.1 phenylalanine--tRNA ligase subunit beta [Beggiatoa leptomitoformis]AUI68969.1 phenylalanine--tRNA ligase subunit beta [Beggiatoa leptomitoformis]
MKFSEQWLRTWVNPQMTTEELINCLTMAGLEVDDTEAVAPAFDNVVVGQVLTVERHPDAEKLKVCQINVGQETPLNIVCGASNVQADMKVPVALIGAVLPNDIRIKKSKLRGVESHGMLCSAKELGLAETSEGLMPLPTDAPIGESVRTYLGLDDTSIIIELTPNRGDCLSIQGIAREVKALTSTTLTAPKMLAIPATIADTFPVRIENNNGCPRYLGRVVRGINPKATTPLWMQERLRRGGIRSINPIVDITNYVLLELGQPMHAFDLAKLNGSIVVRLAKQGEKLTLLNEQIIQLDEQTLVIADEQQPLAIAGVMGGAGSGVVDDTIDIFFESAFFAPRQLAGCARRYGLHTDSSHRFERGVDPQLQRIALERATALLLDIAGGQAGAITEVTDTAQIPSPAVVTVRLQRIQSLLGHSFTSQEINDILQRLNMHVVQQGDIWQITPPSYRFDITIEVDIIEEIARVYGYHNIPARPPQGNFVMQAVPPVALQQLRDVLIQQGYYEAITYSFVDADLQKQLTPDHAGLTLANPIAKRQDNPTAIDMSVMRTTLWTGLLQTAQYNLTRQQARVRLFETGLRFVPSADGLQQERMIAGIVTGSRYPEQWGLSAINTDFFDVKAHVENLLAVSRKPYRFIAGLHPALHPGQTAEIYQDNTLIGIIGALHPQLQQQLDFTQPVYLFELQLAALSHAETPSYTDVSKYPSVRRDLAVVVQNTITADKVLDCVRQSAPNFLAETTLFDVYQGKGIEEGKKSLAIGLIFQEISRNLTESEIDKTLEQILSSLEHQLDAQLRK